MMDEIGERADEGGIQLAECIAPLHMNLQIEYIEPVLLDPSSSIKDASFKQFFWQ